MENYKPVIQTQPDKLWKYFGNLNMSYTFYRFAREVDYKYSLELSAMLFLKKCIFLPQEIRLELLNAI